MPVTQEDIAQQLGISRGLVGYALNGHPRVSAKTRARVQEVASQLGYRPNSSARALVTGRSNQINLCLPALGNTFYAEFIRLFEELTHNTPYDLIVMTSKGLESRQGSLSGDGTIFYGTSMIPGLVPSDNFVMIRHHLCVEPDVPADDFDTVLLDLKDAAREAMEHLIGQGFTRIGYVGPPAMMVPREPRYAAYAAAMAAAGLKEEIVDVPIPLDGRVSEQSVPWLLRYFDEYRFPDALFCCNDDFAIGAYRALRQLGRAIPGETAVMGVDDIREAQDLMPALTTIHLPLDEICRCAWEILMSRLEGGRVAPEQKVFKANLVIRESSLQSR